MLKNYTPGGPKWLPATVQDQTGPLSYRCTLSDGRVVKRHQDQLHTRVTTPPDPPPDSSVISNEPDMPHHESVDDSPETFVQPPAPSSPELFLRRSSRIRKPVDKLNL